MPSPKLSSTVISGDFLFPDGKERSGVKDYELGGVALNDPSQGLQVQEWILSYSNDDIIVTPQTTGAPTTLFTLAGITEASIAFDQNMDPFVVYVVNEQAYYYWYDPTLPGYVHQQMAADVVNPRCCMDDKRFALVSQSDIHIVYLRGDNLYYREQRDRYEVEWPLWEWPVDGPPGWLDTVGMNIHNRLQYSFKSLVGSGPYDPGRPQTSKGFYIGSVISLVTNGLTAVINMPPTNEGDMIVIGIVTRNCIVSAHDPFTADVSRATGLAESRCYILTKVASSDEPETYTFTLSRSGNGLSAIAASFTNTSLVADAGSSSAPPIPARTGVNGGVYVGMAFSTFKNPPLDMSAGVTGLDLANSVINVPNWTSMMMGYRLLSADGNVGPFSPLFGTSGYDGYASVVIAAP